MNTTIDEFTTPRVMPVAQTRPLGVPGAELRSGFPPRPAPTSWPATSASRTQMVARVLGAPFALPHPPSQQHRRLGVLSVVGWLQQQSGDSWQERWRSSGAETRSDWRELLTQNSPDDPDAASARPPRPSRLNPGLLTLMCADVIRPDLFWLVRSAPARRGLAIEMARTRDSGGFAELARMIGTGTVGRLQGQMALTRVAMILAVKGGTIADIQVGDCLELLAAVAETGERDHHGRSPLFYQMLHAHLRWEHAPAAIQVFGGRGQPSCEELIDRYRLQCRPIRDLLVEYLRERQPTVDFSTLQNLAYQLGKLFWADLEAHHPGIDTLKLPREVAAAWKQRVLGRIRTTTGPDGRPVAQTLPRHNGRSVLMSVRALYLDLAEWADDDPARWASWAVRCPVTASDVSHKKLLSQRKSRMDQRTRERLPMLPTLVAWVQDERARTAAMLQAASAVAPGAEFTAHGRTLRRSVLTSSQTSGRVWAQPLDERTRVDLTLAEHRAFWTWAMVEVLRHTGIRIEELTELTHHSLIQYRLPTSGELIPLLQIAPSKTDAERLLVITPELADVLSAIIGRVRGDRPSLPAVVSYDKNERLYRPPMPLLFQCHRHLEDRPIPENTLRGYLERSLAASGLTDRAGNAMRYTFHDFRRLFITDVIMHGMPPHIAQLVAGHRDINTTMGYKAVYPEEAINGHRAFIARRRALRPNEEYRTPTDEEWAEFVGHFERRKVALGDCGRSYATPCIHEHSCVRCPLLRPDPAQRDRLVQLRDNLLARIAEAQTKRWFGEAEGLKVSLAGANDKLAQMDQITARRVTSTDLGIPTWSKVAGRLTNEPTNLRTAITEQE